MKKIISFIIAILISVAINATKYEGTAKQLSVRVFKQHYWSEWSTPVECNVRSVIDLNNNRIVLYSSRIQIYRIISADRKYYENNNECFDFTVIDQDDDISKITFRILKNRVELYIRFSDIQWVYHIY